MISNDVEPRSSTLPVVSTDQKHRPVTLVWRISTAALLTICLFLAEHYSPADVADGSSVDFVISSHEGNLGRRIAYLIVGSIGLALFVRARTRKFSWSNPLVISTILLFAWAALSVTWSSAPDVAVRRLAVLFLIYLGALGIVRSWSHASILAFVVVCAATHLTIGVFDEISMGLFTPLDPSYRFAGTLHWNEQGLACLFLVITAFVAGDVLTKHRQVFRLLSLYGLTFLALTKSRSSMMGLIAGFSLYLALTRSKEFKIRALLLACVVTITMVAFGLLGPIFNLLSRDGEGVDNLTGRQPVWIECLEFVKDRPLAGYGYEDFWTDKRVAYFSEEFHWTISAAHSAYIETLLTLGIVGLVLHTSVLVLGCVRGVNLWRSTSSPIFALAASFCLIFLVVGTLEAVLVVKASPVSFYFAILLSLICVSKRVRPVETRTFIGRRTVTGRQFKAECLRATAERNG